MKAKFYLSLLVVFFISLATQAQEAMFKVLASKGANKVVAGNSSDHKAILIGQKLLSTDKIVIGENAYLGLAHKNGKTIELKKAGTYEVAKLASEVTAQNANVAKKYVDFVAGEMSSQDEDMAKNRHKYMAVTGSVERGLPDVKVLCPKTQECLEDTVLLKWYPVSNASFYKLTFMNVTEDVLYSVETKENFLVLDLAKYKLKDQQNILYKIEVNGKPSKTPQEPSCLKYVSAEKASNLEKEVAEIKATYTEETAINKYILASFYEEKGLVLEAITAYEEAIKLEPGVDEYKAAYGQLLDKHKLSLKK